MRKSGETKASIVKRIVDIDYELSANKNLTPEQRKKLHKQRDSLERRLYH